MAMKVKNTTEYIFLVVNASIVAGILLVEIVTSIVIPFS